MQYTLEMLEQTNPGRKGLNSFRLPFLCFLEVILWRFLRLFRPCTPWLLIADGETLQGALTIPPRARLFFLILPGFLSEDPASANLHSLFFKLRYS